MNDDLDKYNILLKKKEDMITIFILSKYEINVDYCLAKFDPHLNRYYMYGIFTKFANEVLLYHKLIEQFNQELPIKFVLTKKALISLL